LAGGKGADPGIGILAGARREGDQHTTREHPGRHSCADPTDPRWTQTHTHAARPSRDGTRAPDARRARPLPNCHAKETHPSRLRLSRRIVERELSRAALPGSRAQKLDLDPRLSTGIITGGLTRSRLLRASRHRLARKLY